MMKLSIRSCGWAVLAAVGLVGQASDYVSARKLFYAKPEPTPAPVKKEPARNNTPRQGGPKTRDPKQGTVRITTAAVVPGLRYKLIQQVRPGLELAADPDRTFRSRDMLRFEFESNIDGYLYVVQQGSSGRWSVLFPDARINGGANRIERRRPLQVPAGKWYVLNDTPGTERILIFLSKGLLSGLPWMAKPNLPPITVEQSVVNELNNSLRARELVFEKDPEGTPAAAPGGSVYAINNDPGGEAVVVTMTLKHEQ